MRYVTALRIALRHLRSRAFQTFSVVSITAFSAGLAVALFLLAQGLRLGLVRAVEPFELIVGAKGSPYQLALNTVFLQDVPVGNIPWESYAALSDDARTGFAVPLAFGDSYRGYPVVGTTPGILDIRVRASDPPWLRIGEGRWCFGETPAKSRFSRATGPLAGPLAASGEASGFSQFRGRARSPRRGRYGPSGGRRLSGVTRARRRGRRT